MWTLLLFRSIWIAFGAAFSVSRRAAFFGNYPPAFLIPLPSLTERPYLASLPLRSCAKKFRSLRRRPLSFAKPTRPNFKRLLFGRHTGIPGALRSLTG